MENIKEILLEEHKNGNDKITISTKSNNETNNYYQLKCFKNMDEIITLEAKKHNIIKTHKSLFLNLTNLQSIDLSNNCIHKVSKSFSNLKSLKVLKLDFNNIAFLPNLLGEMEKLEILTITNNKLNRLPSSIQNLQKLKVLKVSNNMLDALPIEFGLLKSIEILHIDANHFTEIPTTLCYLKHLSELSFEWLEFLDPPFQKVIKENIGKTIITLIRNSLQEMIKQNFLFCDFLTFLEKNSNNTSRKESSSCFTNKNPSNQNLNVDSIGFNNDNNNSSKELNTETLPDGSNLRKINSIKGRKFDAGTAEANLLNFSNMRNMKIFYAIDNNYFGVIKAMLDSKADFTKIKNIDNKTPLYFSIHNNKFEIMNLILTKIDLSSISNSYIYLHKAIRTRDHALTLKLIDLGVDPNQPDDQGTTCFHVLFSSFTKNEAKCALIGDILLRKVTKLNTLNNDFWAPIHIAARRASKDCLIWILNVNKKLTQEGKETFNLNLMGKNKWTPLHLAVNGFRYEETIILLEAGCNVFAKNADNKTPRKVSNGNCLLTKILRNFEEEYFKNNYFNLFNKENLGKNAKQGGDYLENNMNTYSKNASSNVIFTTVEDFTNIEENVSSMKINKLKDKNDIKSYFKNNINEEKKDSKTRKNSNTENIFNTSTNEITNSNPIKQINNLIVSKNGIENRRKDYYENKDNNSLNDYSKNLGHINSLAPNLNSNSKENLNNQQIQVKFLLEKKEKSNKILLPRSFDFRNSIEGDSLAYSKVQGYSDQHFSLNTRKEKETSTTNNIQINPKSLEVKNDLYTVKIEKDNLTVTNTNLNNTSVNNQCDVSNFNYSLNVIDPLPNNPNIKSTNFNNINYLNNMKGIDDINNNSITMRKKNHSLLNENRCNSNDIINQKNSSRVYNPEVQSRKINLYFHKEIILNSENNLSEKFESLMHIKFSYASIKYEKEEIINVVKIILESLEIEFEDNYLIISEITYWVLSNRVYNLIPALESLVERINIYRRKNDHLLETLEKEILNVLFIMKKTEVSVKKLQSIYYNYSNLERQIKNIKIPPSNGENLSNTDLYINNDLLSSLIKIRENRTLTNCSISSQPQNESMTNIKDSIKIGNKKASFYRNNINFNPANYATNFTNKEKLNKSVFENSREKSEDRSDIKENNEINTVLNDNKNALDDNKLTNSLNDVDKFIVFNSGNFGEDVVDTENDNLDFINKIYSDNNLINFNYIKREEDYNQDENTDLKATNQENELNYTLKEKQMSKKDLNYFKSFENQDNKSECLFDIDTIRKKFFVEEEKLKDLMQLKAKNDDNVEMEIKKFNLGSPELSHNMFDNIFNNMNDSRNKKKFRIVNNKKMNSVTKNKNNENGIKYNKNQVVNKLFNNYDSNTKTFFQNKHLHNSSNNNNFFNNKSGKKENPFASKLQINSSNTKNSRNLVWNANVDKGSTGDKDKNNKMSLNALIGTNKIMPNLKNTNSALSNKTSSISNLKPSNSRKSSNYKIKAEKRKGSSKGKISLNTLNLNFDSVKKFDVSEKMAKSKQSFTFIKEDRRSFVEQTRNDNNIITNNTDFDKASNFTNENKSYRNKRFNYSKSINNFNAKSTKLKFDIGQDANKDNNKKLINPDNEVFGNFQKYNFNLLTEDSIENKKNLNKIKTNENYTSNESKNSKKPIIYSKDYRSNELIKNILEESDNHKKDLNDKEARSIKNNDFYLSSHENKNELGSNKEIQSFLNKKDKTESFEVQNKHERNEHISNDLSCLNNNNNNNNRNPSDSLNYSEKSFLLNENLNNTSSFRIKCVKNIPEIKNANSYFNSVKIKDNHDKYLLDKSELYNLTELDSKNSVYKDKNHEKNLESLKQQNAEKTMKSLEVIKKNFEKINLNNNKESYESRKIPKQQIRSNLNDLISPRTLNNKSNKGVDFEDKAKIDSSRVKNIIALSGKKPINSSDYHSHQDISRHANSNYKFGELDNESCNLIDSCRSIVKNEEHLESKNSIFTAKGKNETLFKNNNVILYQNEYFSSVAPKKIDSSLFDFDI